MKVLSSIAIVAIKTRTRNPISGIPRESFCKAYIDFMEQSTCVQSGHRYHGWCSLPCDGLRHGGYCVQHLASRDAEPELVPCDARQVQDDAQRASQYDD